mmetsp:Transcript_122170/g.243239  ORF Transcript_122170/g.243239 Transcript_122170/m.243239 type:complete len:317 (-) Transcript_122170:395-1345(-)
MTGLSAQSLHSCTLHSTSTSTPRSTMSNETVSSPRTPRSWQHGVARWTLVWCHERSMTQECKALRKMLRRKAHKHGAELLCLKKARMFEQWLSVATEQYVLFTDWREVKHCVEAIAFQDPKNCPMFTSVFCIDAKQQCRAQNWASTLAERKDPIYINGSLSFAGATVMSLLQQASGVPSNDVPVTPKSPLNQLMNDGFQTVQEIQPMKDEVQAIQEPYHSLSPRTDVPILPLFELTQPKKNMQVHNMSRQRQLTKQDVLVAKPANNPMQVVLHANPQVTDLQSKVIAHVAWIWKSLVSPAEVEKALLAAMPECYED